MKYVATGRNKTCNPGRHSPQRLQSGKTSGVVANSAPMIEIAAARLEKRLNGVRVQGSKSRDPMVEIRFDARAAYEQGRTIDADLSRHPAIISGAVSTAGPRQGWPGACTCPRVSSTARSCPAGSSCTDPPGTACTRPPETHPQAAWRINVQAARPSIARPPAEYVDPPKPDPAVSHTATD